MIRLILAAPLVVIGAPQQVADIGVGDPLRAALLDALRPVIARDLGQPVKFVVEKLRAKGDWAFAVVRPQTPEGRAIDFSRTRYAPLLREGVFDGDTTYALLRRTKGVWQVRDFVIGPTDVAWEDWPARHGAPRDLLFD